MSSSPIGGDAVKNSIVVSIFFAILTFFLFPCERQSLLRSCSRRKLSEALAMRASLGLTYRDHLADPVDSHQGVNIATKAGDTFLLPAGSCRRRGRLIPWRDQSRNVRIRDCETAD